MKNFLQKMQMRKRLSENALIIILVVGFLHGLLYVFITPPWWHHDESGHFLVVKFVAEYGYHPAFGDADGMVTDELLDSLDRAGIFELVKYKGREGEKLPPWVLAPQAQDPPFYYAVAALPLRLFENASLELQVRVLRLFSLSFFLLTLWVSWQINGILFAEKDPLRWLGTVFLALLPGFINEMTIIGNTPLGVLFFAIYLWMGVSLLYKGFSWRALLLLGVSVIACYYTNNLTWLPVLISLPLIILFLPFHNRLEWVPWVVTIFLAVLIPLILFKNDEARYWYKTNRSDVPTRLEFEHAPHGKTVFELSYGETVRQRIPEDVLIARDGETLTFGMWAWASEPTQIIAPRFIFYEEELSVVSPAIAVDLVESPTFYTFEIEIPVDSDHSFIQIAPKAKDGVNPSVYLDGLLLVDGAYNQGTPQFGDKNASNGLWGGEAFKNLLRNGSAESTWLRPAPFLWEVLPSSVSGYFGPSAVVTFQDWRGSSWYFKRATKMLNETFWGKFGQSIIPLLGMGYMYDFLRWISLIIFLGAIGWGWRIRHRLAWHTSAGIFLLFLASGVLWGQFFLRGATTTDSTGVITPWARYALPGFLPTAILFSAGLYTVFQYFIERFGVKSSALPAKLVLFFMVTLDIFALLTMIHYFYLQTQWPYLVLFLLLFLALSAYWVIDAKKAPVLQGDEAVEG